MSSGSAFGKVIVLGEHAVVYGQPALASALAQGCTVTVTPGEGRMMIDTDVHAIDNADHAVCRAVKTTLDAAGLNERVDVRIHFDIPAGAGLGSSAALSVALPRAVAAFTGKSVDVTTISNAIEKVFHGNPSGLDALLAETGAIGLFTRAGGLKPVVPSQPLRVVIADTGVPRSTQTQVSNVAERLKRLGSPIEKTIEVIGELSRRGAEAVAAGNHQMLGELMDVNQGLLSALGVSSPEIESLVGIARRAGAYGAKLTGAGGGGCIIAIGNEESVASALKPHAKSVLVSTLGST